MTGSTIITQFELQVDDITELSSSEELIVANRVIRTIYNDRPWEFLKKEATGTVSSLTADVPADFAYFVENYKYTNNAISTQINKTPIVIFVGTALTPYYVVNFSDRKQYQNSNGYAYYDARQNTITFTGTPNINGSSFSFDYVYVPDDITTATSPVMPARFHDIVVFGMSVDNDIMQKSPKATSYAAENQMKYENVKKQMEWWNANLQMN